MVSRKDHFVASADVRRSVEAICAEGIVTMFQHFLGLMESSMVDQIRSTWST